jgi:hypothetical protein
VESQGLLGQVFGLVNGGAGRDAAGKVRKGHPVVAIRVFMNKGDIVRHGKLLTQSEAGLSFDAPESLYGDIFGRMGHGSSSRSLEMLELDMGAFLSDPIPAGGFELLNHLPAIHYVIIHNINSGLNHSVEARHLVPWK